MSLYNTESNRSIPRRIFAAFSVAFVVVAAVFSMIPVSASAADGDKSITCGGYVFESSDVYWSSSKQMVNKDDDFDYAKWTEGAEIYDSIEDFLPDEFKSEETEVSCTPLYQKDRFHQDSPIGYRVTMSFRTQVLLFFVAIDQDDAMPTEHMLLEGTDYFVDIDTPNFIDVTYAYDFMARGRPAEVDEYDENVTEDSGGARLYSGNVNNASWGEKDVHRYRKNTEIAGRKAYKTFEEEFDLPQSGDYIWKGYTEIRYTAVEENVLGGIDRIAYIIMGIHGDNSYRSSQLARADKWVEDYVMNVPGYRIFGVRQEERTFVSSQKSVTADSGDGSTNDKDTTTTTHEDEGGSKYTVTRTHVDKGSDIFGPVAVGIGVIGAGGIAAGVIGKKGRKKRKDENGKEEQEKEQPSSFDMIVYKDFGDTLFQGERAKNIGARIVEIKPLKGGGTQEIARGDITSQIQISSSDPVLKVEPEGMNGDYKMAMVSVPARSEILPYSAEVIFASTTPYGRYVERMLFQIAGEPVLEFVDKKPGSMEYVRNFILGDNRTYTVRVRLKYFDRTREPVFTFGGDALSNGLSARAQKDPGPDADMYVIYIKNDSVAPEAAFAPGEAVTHVEKKKQIRHWFFNVEASNTEQRATGTIYCDFYQDGLSASCRDVLPSGDILLDTRPQDEAATQFLSTAIQFTLCISDPQQGAIVVEPEKYKVSFDRMEAQDEAINNVMEKFGFRVDERYKNQGFYSIEPTSGVPHKRNHPRYVGGHFATAVYNGQRYPLFLSYEFEGIISESMEDVQREIENIKKICRLCGVSNGTRMLLRQDLTKLSVRELCLIRKAIFDDFVAFEESNAREFNDFAGTLDKWISNMEIAKWLGDQAFSYLVQYYAAIYVGPEWASTVEAVVVPWKDMFVTWVGEGYAGEHWYDGITADSLTNAAFSQAENLLMNLLGEYAESAFVSKGLDMKSFAAKCAAIVSMYLTANFAKHYCAGGEEQGKIYDSIVATTGDLSANALKLFISTVIAKAMHTDAKNLEKRLTNTLEKVCESNVRIDYISELLTKKYGKELGAVNATEKLTKNFTETTMQTIADVVEKTGALNEFEDLVFKYASEIYGDKISELGQEWMKEYLDTKPGQFFTDIVTFIVKNIERTGTDIVSILWDYVLNMGQFMLSPAPLSDNPEPIKK